MYIYIYIHPSRGHRSSGRLSHCSNLYIYIYTYVYSIYAYIYLNIYIYLYIYNVYIYIYIYISIQGSKEKLNPQVRRPLFLHQNWRFAMAKPWICANYADGKNSAGSCLCQITRWYATWWLIPLSKWVITPVINAISRVNPLITGVITHLLSGMSHQVVQLLTSWANSWVFETTQVDSLLEMRKWSGWWPFRPTQGEPVSLDFYALIWCSTVPFREIWGLNNWAQTGETSRARSQTQHNVVMSYIDHVLLSTQGLNMNRTQVACRFTGFWPTGGADEPWRTKMATEFAPGQFFEAPPRHGVRPC